MFVIAGASGKSGRVVADTLLSQGKSVRVVVRDAAKASELRSRGADVAVASLDDARALERALHGATGFYTLLPEDLAAAEFHAHRRQMADAMATAIKTSRIPHVVFLSAVAATLPDGNGPAKDLHYAEAALRAVASNITIVRASYFQENVLGSLAPAKHEGIYPNFVPSADFPFPTVATRDVGRLAARCLVEPPARSEVLDLVGPAYSVRDMAERLGRTLGKSLRVIDVPAEAHVDVLTKAGLPRPFAEAVAEMFACFASGRISPKGDRVVAATTTLDETLSALLGGEKKSVMTIDALREAAARLNTAATALAALGAALESRTAERPLDPAIHPHAEHVLGALGLAGAFDGVSKEDLMSLFAEIRTLTLTNAKLTDASLRDFRWAPTEPALMQAAGDATARFPRTLSSAIAPKLDGLLSRLSSPDAAFLEVGVGVGALAIQMARTWPDLRVVGLDVWAPALALARENVRAAGLEERIELRETPGESIAYEEVFDLAWIPSLFVPERVLPELLRRVHRALRPTGWLLFPMLKPSTDPLASSVARLRTALWGGSLASTEEVEQWLGDAGFAEVRRLPAAPVAMAGMLAARKAS